jgi:8-oxo-dGTP pyrophosphatase MutT (NUDIX family)
MTDFASSYLGRLRAVVGDRLLLVPGMRIVVERPDGAILLQLRSDYRLWGLPGGVPDEGEGADETVIRETFEETGIQVSDPRPFGFACDPGHEVWTYPNGDRCHYFTLLYVARRFTGEVIGGNDESLKVGWFMPDDLPPLLPVMQRTLDAYARFRGTGEFQMI